MDEKAINNVLLGMAMENVNLKLEIERLKIQNDQLKEQLLKEEKESIEKEGE